MRYLLALVLVGLVTLAGCQSGPDYGTEISKEALLREHNRVRSGAALQVSQELEKAAQGWAEQMARDGNLRHGNFQSRLSGSWRTAGENIACGQNSVQEVMRGWMKSPGHRRNILNRSYKYVGFGIAYSRNGVVYWVADFGG